MYVVHAYLLRTRHISWKLILSPQSSCIDTKKYPIFPWNGAMDKSDLKFKPECTNVKYACKTIKSTGSKSSYSWFGGTVVSSNKKSINALLGICKTNHRHRLPSIRIPIWFMIIVIGISISIQWLQINRAILNNNCQFINFDVPKSPLLGTSKTDFSYRFSIRNKDWL